MLYTFDINKWGEFERYDLKMIPIMYFNSWIPEFSHIDIMHKRIYPNSMGMPAFAVSFKKGNKYTWQIINRNTHTHNWQVADIIEGKFENHRSYTNLDEVLEHE